MKHFFKYASILISLLALTSLASCDKGGTSGDYYDDETESSSSSDESAGKVSITYKEIRSGKCQFTVHYSGKASDVKLYGLKTDMFSRELSSSGGYCDFHSVPVKTNKKNNNINGYVILKSGKKISTHKTLKFK